MVNAGPLDSLRHLADSAAGRNWLRRLPKLIARALDRWDAEISQHLTGNANGAWVARVRIGDERSAVIKIGWPHLEARQERLGLRAWGGHAMVRLLDDEPADWALLLEDLVPGDALAKQPPALQDQVLTQTLQSLWRTAVPSEIAPLAEMVDFWIRPSGSGRSVAGPLLHKLSRDSVPAVLLATDLHAGNILRGRIDSWVAIDPKPFVGDPCYDLTQHLLNHLDRVAANPGALIEDLAGRLQLDPVRVRSWLYGRLLLNDPVSGSSGRRIVEMLRDEGQLLYV